MSTSNVNPVSASQDKESEAPACTEQGEDIGTSATASQYKETEISAAANKDEAAKMPPATDQEKETDTTVTASQDTETATPAATSQDGATEMPAATNQESGTEIAADASQDKETSMEKTKKKSGKKSTKDGPLKTWKSSKKDKKNKSRREKPAWVKSKPKPKPKPFLPSMLAHTNPNNFPPPPLPPPMVAWYPMSKLLNQTEWDMYGSSYHASKSGWLSLDNPVHPIFAQSQFEHAPYINYEALKPSLRLASLLIDTPCLMKYWHAVLFSKPQKVVRKDGRKLLSLFRKGSKLNAKEVAKVRAALLELVPHVKFVKTPAMGGMVTRPLMSRKVTPSFDKFGGSVASRIGYSAGAYEQLNGAYHYVLREPQGDFHEENKSKALNFYMDFAVQLCHELAHALDNSRFGPVHRGFYGFEEQPVNESGFTWTYTVLGGIPQGWCQFSDWPTPSIVDLYFRCNNHMIVSGVGDDKPLSESGEVLWKIPDYYLRALFQKHFWDVVVPREGAKALEIPRIMGSRFGRQMPHDCQCESCQGAKFNYVARRVLGGAPMEYQMEIDEFYAQQSPSFDSPDVMHPEPGQDGRDRGQQKGTRCEAETWVDWFRPQRHDDPRSPRTFAMQDGKYRSLLDGTVVRKENYLQLFKIQREARGLSVREACRYMYPGDEKKALAKEEKYIKKVEAQKKAEEEGVAVVTQPPQKPKTLRKRRSAEWWGLSVV